MRTSACVKQHQTTWARQGQCDLLDSGSSIAGHKQLLYTCHDVLAICQLLQLVQEDGDASHQQLSL